MITVEELKTYTKEELVILNSMIKELQKKGDGPVKKFYINLNKEKEYTRNELYDMYKIYAEENNIIIQDKALFNKASNLYIDDIGIKLKKRIKEKPEKINNGGIVAIKYEE